MSDSSVDVEAATATAAAAAVAAAGAAAPSPDRVVAAKTSSGRQEHSAVPLSHLAESSTTTEISTTTMMNMAYGPSQSPDRLTEQSDRSKRPCRTCWLPLGIALLGLFAGCSIVLFGLFRSERDRDHQFNVASDQIVQQIQLFWREIERNALWVHNVCRDRSFTRQQFRELYEHIDDKYGGIGFLPNITNEERDSYEAEARDFLKESYPSVLNASFPYRGLKEYEPDPQNPSKLTWQTRSQQEFYFPIHYVEPIGTLAHALDFDMYSLFHESIDLAIREWKPVMTQRRRTGPNSFNVDLLHPGIPLTTRPGLQPRDLSQVLIQISELLDWALICRQQFPLTTYLYDSTDKSKAPEFLGGAYVEQLKTNFVAERSLADLRSARGFYFFQKELPIASRQWTVVVVSHVRPYHDSVVLYACIGGATVFFGCLIVAAWVLSSGIRHAKVEHIQARAEAEKTAFTLDTAKKVARQERELNDFIAHEVRNPLSAALSACSFVSSAVHEEEEEAGKAQASSSAITPLFVSDEKRLAVKEDLEVIESALNFMNDLLRNMLDMQRADADQIKIESGPVNILRDVFVPVDTLMYRRRGAISAGRVRVEVDCPSNLVVMSDRMRLQQIVLNLGINALKFVSDCRGDEGQGDGYIRLRATTNPKSRFVTLYVEDSGPGIPMEKRERVFTKYQDSLGSLHQGTGIGLCLCHMLIQLMGGEIWLDESFKSGMLGCQGSRFVINLKVKPLEISNGVHVGPTTGEQSAPDANRTDIRGCSVEPSTNVTLEESCSKMLPENVSTLLGESWSEELPENVSVLFVDDDRVLRKLFSRVLRKVAPASWLIAEATDGESALKKVHQDGRNCYDLIFMDMYMPGRDGKDEKQLLGTETVRELRSMGVTSMICGLSANDVGQEFLESGADTFILKPLPTKPATLKAELLQLLRQKYCCRPMGFGEREVVRH